MLNCFRLNSIIRGNLSIRSLSYMMLTLVIIIRQSWIWFIMIRKGLNLKTHHQRQVSIRLLHEAKQVPILRERHLKYLYGFVEKMILGIPGFTVVTENVWFSRENRCHLRIIISMITKQINILLLIQTMCLVI